MGLKKRGFRNSVDNMIREIRPLQSADQNRLRDDHTRREAKDSFVRHLNAANTPQPGDTIAVRKQEQNIPRPGLLNENAMWSKFFADLNSSNANDSEPLFHWGEQREAAKQHTQTARRSALLNGTTPFHFLNEKI
jgi:hypothetical protein